MEDNTIVDLYWQRSEEAIVQTQKKYGGYCYSIAYRILYSKEDAEECVNDTYVKAWGAIPPHRPQQLSAFLGKITRNLALNRYARDRAQKRSAHMELVLEEMQEILSDPADQIPLSDQIALREAINGFVGSLPRQTRNIFVQRYWYVCSIQEIAQDLGLSESHVKVTLLRTRRAFKAHLEKEGISV